MTGLVLELRPGEAMIINGALVRFRTRSRIELVAKARFMFGKQIMAPEQADSPARRIYFALQSAYIGEGAERMSGLANAHDLIVAFKAATTSALAREILDRAEAAAAGDNCYLALKLARRIINHEDTVLGRSSPAREAVLPSGARDVVVPSGARDVVVPPVARGAVLPSGARVVVPSGARGAVVPSGSSRNTERISEAHA
ncbi:MAG: flagellar biosynthesis repressor FlbT [Acetobacteraceae bacterium]